MIRNHMSNSYRAGKPLITGGCIEAYILSRGQPLSSVCHTDFLLVHAYSSSPYPVDSRGTEFRAVRMSTSPVSHRIHSPSISQTLCGDGRGPPSESGYTQYNIIGRPSTTNFFMESFMRVQNMAGALVNPNGMTKNSKAPYLVTQVASSLSAMRTW